LRRIGLDEFTAWNKYGHAQYLLLHFTIHRSEPAEYVQFKVTIVVRSGT